jgi:tryptophan-rich sensory protein
VLAGAIVLTVALIVLVPLLIVWSLNTLFPMLAIPYDVWSWLAVVVLFGAVRANVKIDRMN